MRWKAVPGYEGRYSVCEDGRILSNLTNRILRPGRTSRGYWSVQLYEASRPKKSKSYLVHRIVLAAFIGPCPKGQQVNHRNMDRADNRLENLEYVTQSENVRHADAMRPRMKRTQHAAA